MTDTAIHEPFTRVTQTHNSPGPARLGDVPGNCMQAAVASALCLPLESVPHFVLFGGSWEQALRLWADWVGLTVNRVDTREIPDGVSVLLGITRRSPTHHAVVGFDGAQVWDPHPSGEGLAIVTDAITFTRTLLFVPCRYCGMSSQECASREGCCERCGHAREVTP